MKLFWPLFLCLWPWAGPLRGEVAYTNFTRTGPIEIHVIRIPRRDASLEFQSIHAGGKPIGRSPVSEQIKRIASGTPLAAINGDFFQLDGPFAGDPRGLQIVSGAMISAPAGNASFWMDAAGAPHMALTRSALRITWPDGSSAPLGLNAKCGTNELMLYTPDVESVDRENIGREIVLRSDKNAALQAGQTYAMTVGPGEFRLAMGIDAVRRAPALKPGAVVKISTATVPNLRGAATAISGGPLLIISGKRQAFDRAESNAFRHRFMVEKHPRTALGWSDKEFFWVEVDGRRQDSVGMTLNELGMLMMEFGCVEAMNLDGGGSSTIWFDGKVRNRPSDGAERPVANALALVRKPATAK